MRLEDWQNSVNVRNATDSAILEAYGAVSEVIGRMAREGRSLRFVGAELLEQALHHIVEAERHLVEMRKLEDED